MAMFASIQSNRIISVTQQMLKRTSRKALRRHPPFTSISGRMPSGPGLFPSWVFLKAWSSSCSSIGRLIDSMTVSWSMPSAMVKSASVGWFSKSVAEMFNPSVFYHVRGSQELAIFGIHWMRGSGSWTINSV